MLFFREFRPMDSQQLEETLLDGGVSARGLWLVLFCLSLPFSPKVTAGQEHGSGGPCKQT